MKFGENIINKLVGHQLYSRSEAITELLQKSEVEIISCNWPSWLSVWKIKTGSCLSTLNRVKLSNIKMKSEKKIGKR